MELDLQDKLDWLVIPASRETVVQRVQQVARDQLANREMEDLLDYRVQWDSQVQMVFLVQLVLREAPVQQALVETGDKLGQQVIKATQDLLGKLVIRAAKDSKGHRETRAIPDSPGPLVRLVRLGQLARLARQVILVIRVSRVQKVRQEILDRLVHKVTLGLVASPEQQE